MSKLQKCDLRQFLKLLASVALEIESAGDGRFTNL